MWVLSPLLPSASQKAVDEGALPNPVQFLTSGKITIGRPAKKGGTTGKADILIFNESSVSTLHAAMEVQPAADDGTHGTVTLTDTGSKFGTYVRSSDNGAQELRLQPQQQHQLQPNDIIRFGNKMRYQLQQVPVSICPASNTSSSNATTFLQAAAACNISVVSSCSVITNSSEACHAIAADGDELTPASIAALLLKLPLVTPDWVTAVAAKKVHAQSLPEPEGFSTKQLLLPKLPGQQQQQQQVLDVASWKQPLTQLLQGYQLLFFDCQGQDDLAVAAKALGAAVELASGQVPSQPQLEAAESKAAAGGLAAVLVLPAAEAAALQAAVITPEQLLLVLATGDAAPIAAATVVRRAEVAAAAAAAEAAAAAAHSASENMTEAEETEEGDAAGGSEEQLQPVVPVVHTRATRHRGAASLAAKTAKSPAAAKAKSPAAKTKSPAAKARDTKSPAGKGRLLLQLKQSTPNSTRASKRSAAVFEAEELAATAEPAVQPRAAAAAAAPGGRKRRKVAAAVALIGHGDDDDAVVDTPDAAGDSDAAGNGQQLVQQQQEQVQQQQQQQQPGGQADATAGDAAIGADPVQIKEGIFTAALIVPMQQDQQQQQGVLQGSSVSSNVNYKAFRRKGQQQQQLGAAGPTAASVWQLVPVLRELQGTDTDTFLKDEQARLDRLKKADELFNANLRPKAVKPAAAAGQKRPAGRVR